MAPAGKKNTFAVARPASPVVVAARKRAAEQFVDLAWPTPREEEYRRTDLGDFPFEEYRPADTVDSEWDAGAGFGAMTVSALDRVDESRGVVVCGLNAVPQDLLARFEATLDSGLREAEGNRLIAWHYAHLDQGGYVYVPPFVDLERPLFVELHHYGSRALFTPHLVLDIDTGAKATVVIRYRSRGEGSALCNAVVQAKVSDGASLDWIELQGLNEESVFFSHAAASLGKDARLHRHDAVFGSRLAKSRVAIGLNGPGSDAQVEGAFFARRGEHFDLRSIQEHRAPHTTSRALYKGVVRDSARTVYQGLIDVGSSAAGTDAYLTNKNLVLNSGARADSIPSLSIDTNDVRCSHGATTGKVREEELFYLMSRGLDRGEARRLIVTGFFEELVDRLPKAAGDAVRQSIVQRLEAAV
jgi:Fe-S cluster assembly protein SufD